MPPKKTKKNIAGFFAGGQFHPIRSPKFIKKGNKKVTDRAQLELYKDLYNEFEAGDFDSPTEREERKAKNRVKSEKTWKQQIENQLRREAFGDNESDKAGKSLLQFVRSLGGIRPSVNKRTGKAYDAGELSEFTFKESKKRGLVSAKSSYTLDGAFQAAREEGYDVKDENDLLDKMSDEIRSGKATFKTHGFLDYRDNPANEKTMKKKKLTANQIKAAAATLAKLFPGQTAGQIMNKIKGKSNTSKATAKRPTATKKPRPIKRNPDAATAEAAAEFAAEFLEAFDVDESGNLTQKDIAALAAADDEETGIVLNQIPSGEMIVQWSDGSLSLEDSDDLVFANGVKAIYARYKAKRALGKALKAEDKAKKARSAATAAARKAKSNPGLLTAASELLVGASAAFDVARNLKGKQKSKSKVRTNTNRAKVRRVRTNPYDAFEEFQGRKSDHTLELDKPENCPSNLWALGQLIEVRVKGHGAIDFTKFGKDLYLCADNNNENLYICGAKIAKPDNELEKDFIAPLGEIISGTYLTEKRHLGDEPGKPSYYKHRFGDEGGERPLLALDNKGFGIIDGGDYEITSLGIRN